MNVFNFLRKYLTDTEYNQLVSDYKSSKLSYEEILTKYNDLIIEQENEILTNVKEEYWNNKHTKKDITYYGRSLIYYDNNNEIKANVNTDIKNFITPNDCQLKELIKNNDLEVKDIYNCNDDIVKIYKFCRENAAYKYDSVLLGRDEVWLFPFEFLYLNKRGDCDDSGSFITSMLIAAGVPSFRVRSVCGECNLGGHYTTYVLGDDLTTWYHINSTGLASEYGDDLTNYPTSNDAGTKDGLGIKDVWFSFNNEYSWSDFEQKTTSANFNNELGEVIKIN